MDASQWVELAKNGGLVLVVVALVTGKLVPEWAYKQLLKLYEEEKALNRKLLEGTREGTALADRGAQLAEQILENAAAVRQRRPEGHTTRQARSETER